MLSESGRKRLDEIDARTNAATKGPWEAKGSIIRAATEGFMPKFIGEIDQLCDSEFCAHSRDDIPFLRGLVNRLEKDSEESHKLIEQQGKELNRRDETINRMNKELQAALKEIGGTCRLCKNAKPYDKAFSVCSPLRICEHLKDLNIAAATRQKGCEYFEWRGPCKENGGQK